MKVEINLETVSRAPPKTFIEREEHEAAPPAPNIIM